jgi:hypothetical protein
MSVTWWDGVTDRCPMLPVPEDPKAETGVAHRTQATSLTVDERPMGGILTILVTVVGLDFGTSVEEATQP